MTGTTPGGPQATPREKEHLNAERSHPRYRRGPARRTRDNRSAVRRVRRRPAVGGTLRRAHPAPPLRHRDGPRHGRGGGPHGPGRRRPDRRGRRPGDQRLGLPAAAHPGRLRAARRRARAVRHRDLQRPRHLPQLPHGHAGGRHSRRHGPGAQRARHQHRGRQRRHQPRRAGVRRPHGRWGGRGRRRPRRERGPGHDRFLLPHLPRGRGPHPDPGRRIALPAAALPGESRRLRLLDAGPAGAAHGAPRRTLLRRTDASRAVEGAGRVRPHHPPSGQQVRAGPDETLRLGARHGEHPRRARQSHRRVHADHAAPRRAGRPGPPRRRAAVHRHRGRAEPGALSWRF